LLVVNSIILIYYYLYPIVVMFFRPLTPGFVKPRIMAATTALALILTIFGIDLGLMPNRLLRQRRRGPQWRWLSVLRARHFDRIF
jgi:NADH:ubiquinone oxidoreductase subunit 2 (subunit N)